MSKIVLKPGREVSLLRRHPWIFSGAIESRPHFENGDILPVYSHEGTFLAQAYFHTQNSIAGRVLSFEPGDVLSAVRTALHKAVALRKPFTHGNCFRLVNAEGDDLPGLIVDCYDDVIVMQINTCGMEKLKHQIVAMLVDILKPRTIYEKSLTSSRKQEGLLESQGLLYGTDVDEVEVVENGIRFIVSIKKGQKTGFFLDQREMRKSIAALASGKKVLNAFAYSGGFSLAALVGGAVQADSVDISADACELAKRNLALNGYGGNVFCEDVFVFLERSPLPYDLVILDPPAFAKKKSDLHNASQGYKKLNRLALEKMARGSLLLTCSCSYYIDTSLFQTLLFQAAVEAKRNVKILSHHIQASDHPISLYHPEGEYLKSLLLYVD